MCTTCAPEEQEKSRYSQCEQTFQDGMVPRQDGWIVFPIAQVEFGRARQDAAEAASLAALFRQQRRMRERTMMLPVTGLSVFVTHLWCR